MKENKSGRHVPPKMLLIGVGLVMGVLLLIMGSLPAGEEREGAQTAIPSASEYEEALERRLETLCRAVDGAGEVRVMVTFAGGYRSLYEKDADGACATVGSGKTESAVLSSLQSPEILGVGIVATGAGSEQVRGELLSLVSAALGVGTHKIYITR